MSDKQPKVDGGSKNQSHCSGQGKQKIFKAPTQGLESVIFDYGVKGCNPTIFNKNNKKLLEYVGANYKVDGPMAAQALCNLKAPIIDSLASPSNKGDDVVLLNWKLNFEAAHKKWLAWTENNQKLFNLYLSHCMQAMKTKLKALSEWTAISTAQNGIGLVQLICAIMHKRDKTTPSILDIVQADKQMYLTF